MYSIYSESWLDFKQEKDVLCSVGIFVGGYCNSRNWNWFRSFILIFWVQVCNFIVVIVYFKPGNLVENEIQIKQLSFSGIFLSYDQMFKISKNTRIMVSQKKR